MIGLTDFDLHAPELAQKFRLIEQNVLNSGQPMIDEEEFVVDASGDGKWLSSTKVPLRNAQNEIFGLVGIAHDITARKQADVLRNGQAHILEMIAMSAPLEDVLDRLMRLVESQLTGIIGSVLLLDKDGSHLRHGAAPGLAKDYTNAIDGIAIGPKVGSCGTAVYRREPVIVADIMQDPLWEDYRELVSAFGYRSCWSTPILSHQGTVLGVFAMYSMTVREPAEAETRLIDFTTRIAGIAIERKLAEDQIHFMANHDVLTGLPNRALLEDRLSQAILYAQRYDRWVTVVFIDLDNFKLVNDTLGHNAGDELLKIVARRMVECVRATDTVVRLGGDEFVIVLFDQPTNVDLISETLQKIRTAIAEPVHLGEHRLRATASIGIANYPKDGAIPDTLLANADAAMYRAKEFGRDNFQFYAPEFNTRAHEKFVLQEELRNALARSEFALLYQPQVDLRSGRVFAVEALIRWNHPTLGMVAPTNFIPTAEETGLIVPIGDWVLHEACRQNKAWQDAGLPPMTVCVNVSARQFRERNLVGRVVNALRDSGLEARYLELEVTESLIMQDIELAVATMNELQGLGVQISIDDFGTGYSSLSALKTFPVARLENRQVFHQRRRRRRKRPGCCQRRDFVGSKAEHEGHCRGRRNRRSGGFPAQEQLRRNAGLSFQQAGLCPGHREIAQPRGLTGCSASSLASARRRPHPAATRLLLLFSEHKAPVAEAAVAAVAHIGKAEASEARVEHIAAVAGRMHPDIEQLLQVEAALGDVLGGRTRNAVALDPRGEILSPAGGVGHAATLRHVAGLLQGCLFELRVGDQRREARRSADTGQRAGGGGGGPGAFTGWQRNGTAGSEPGQGREAGCLEPFAPVQACLTDFDFFSCHACLT